MSAYSDTYARNQAEAFIAALTGREDTPVTFQTFPDGDETSAAPAWFHAPLADVWDRLLDLQEHGHGVFVMVNEGDGKGRSGAHVVRLRALFADDDANQLRPAGLGRRPNMIVRSGHGLHVYWRLVGGEPLRLFTPAQKAIAAKLGTDPAVNDLARVMRLPGTLNLKDRSKPVAVELVAVLPEAAATVADILLDLGAAPTAPAKGPPPAASPVAALSPFTVERARAYVAEIHAVEGSGGDADTFRAAAALLRDFNLTRERAWELLVEWNETNAHPPWDVKELGKKFANAARHGKGPIGSKTADKMAGLVAGSDGKTVLDKVVERGPRLDPANWVSDLSLSRPWRYWRAGAWADGISEANMDRLLGSEGGLTPRAIKAWKKKPICVEFSGPVYHSAERIAFMRDGARVANTFRRPVLSPLAGDWTPIGLVLDNITNGDEEARGWFEGWLGKLTQAVYAGRPARIGTAPVFTGPKGSGKGTLAEVCKGLLGRWNVVEIAQGDLDSSFNSWLDGILLVFANEVFTSDNRTEAASAKIKDAITCHERQINKKGVPQVTRPAVENWIFASNSYRPLPVEKNDRRFTVVRTGPAISPDLGAQVADDARADGPIVRAFLHYLLSLPASALVGNYRPLQTSAKAAVQAASGTSAVKFAAEVAARGLYSVTPPGSEPRDLYLTGPDGFRSLAVGPRTEGPIITRRRLMEAYRVFCGEIGAPAQQEIAVLAALREELPELVEGELLVEGRRERVVAALPGMLPELATVTVAPPESPLPEQRSFAV